MQGPVFDKPAAATAPPPHTHTTTPTPGVVTTSHAFMSFFTTSTACARSKVYLKKKHVCAGDGAVQPELRTARGWPADTRQGETPSGLHPVPSLAGVCRPATWNGERGRTDDEQRVPRVPRRARSPTGSTFTASASARTQACLGRGARASGQDHVDPGRRGTWARPHQRARVQKRHVARRGLDAFFGALQVFFESRK